MKFKTYVFGILLAGAGACIFSLDASERAATTSFEVAESILKKEFFDLRDQIAAALNPRGPRVGARTQIGQKAYQDINVLYDELMNLIEREAVGFYGGMSKVVGEKTKKLIDELGLLKNKTDSFNALKALHDADIAAKLEQVKNLFANIQLSSEQIQQVTEIINQIKPKNAIANEVKVLTSPQAAGWFSNAKGTAGGVISGLWQKIPSISQIKQSAKDHKLLAAAGGIALVGLLSYGGYCAVQASKQPSASWGQWWQQFKNQLFRKKQTSTFGNVNGGSNNGDGNGSSGEEEEEASSSESEEED